MRELTATLDELVAVAREWVVPGGRRLLGITGAPGAGKSTLAEAIDAALGEDTVLVGMDGYHLANVELARLGRADRKGAPDTFDAAGYVALLTRLRHRVDRCVYAPEFRREIEEPVAGAVPVPAEIPLVITEGNYLLVEAGDWAGVRPVLDAVWYVEVDEGLRLERLVRRHAAFGKSPEAAHAWSHGSDQRNADVVAVSRHRADLVIRMRD